MDRNKKPLCRDVAKIFPNPGDVPCLLVVSEERSVYGQGSESFLQAD